MNNTDSLIKALEMIQSLEKTIEQLTLENQNLKNQLEPSFGKWQYCHDTSSLNAPMYRMPIKNKQG